MLSPDHAHRFAAIALANIDREYPAKLDHVLAADADARPPRELHPAFYGSYDWHSCVHMHWLLVHARRSDPRQPLAAAVDALLERRLAPAAIAAELAYLGRPDAAAFERTYGWAWLLKLAQELAACDDAAARRWSAQLAPLAAAFGARYRAWLPRAGYPIRHGNHPNSAFGLLFALDYARAAGDIPLATLCVTRAQDWFSADRDAPARWEPSGADFLSPTLVEADLMRRVLAPRDFAAWLDAFLPGLAAGAPASLLRPAAVADRSDPQIVHLDGLNLSRAWNWRGIAAAFPAADPRAQVARDAAQSHLEAGLAGLAAADYAGSHWLASFAALALGAERA
jgi:hypothetical protein